MFEIERIMDKQPYLELLYKTILAIGYYGLFRIGELVTPGEHTMKARDLYLGKNKNKILIVLYSSKTHDKESYPQEIKITGRDNVKSNRFFCPFQLIKQYKRLRGPYQSEVEPLFIHQDKSPVTDVQLRNLLKTLIERIGLNKEFYDVHSLRIGRSSQLFQLGYSVQHIQIVGRWKSNAVYKYLRS